MLPLLSTRRPVEAPVSVYRTAWDSLSMPAQTMLRFIGAYATQRVPLNNLLGGAYYEQLMMDSAMRGTAIVELQNMGLAIIRTPTTLHPNTTVTTTVAGDRVLREVGLA